MISYKTKNLVRMLMIVLLAPMLAIGSVLYQTYDGIQDAKTDFAKTSCELRSLEWLAIESIIMENVDKANIQALSIKKDVTTNLLNEYSGNMEQLKTDIHNDRSSKAFDIMNAAISNVYLNNKTENNRIFIADKYGVIVDRGLKSSNKDSRSWKSEIESKENTELASNAVGQILNQENILTYWQVKQSYNEPATITNPSMDALKQDFLENGLSSLAKYDMLVPSYITDNGDIFGIPDVNFRGFRNANDKLIVIQEFNIYDSVYSHRELIDSYTGLMTKSETDLKDHISDLVRNMFTTVVILVLAFIGILSSAIVCLKWSRDDANRGSN